MPAPNRSPANPSGRAVRLSPSSSCFFGTPTHRCHLLVPKKTFSFMSIQARPTIAFHFLTHLKFFKYRRISTLANPAVFVMVFEILSFHKCSFRFPALHYVPRFAMYTPFRCSRSFHNCSSHT